MPTWLEGALTTDTLSDAPLSPVPMHLRATDPGDPLTPADLPGHSRVELIALGRGSLAPARARVDRPAHCTKCCQHFLLGGV